MKKNNVFRQFTIEKNEEKIENIDRIKEKNTTRIIEFPTKEIESEIIPIETEEKEAVENIKKESDADLN